MGFDDGERDCLRFMAISKIFTMQDATSLERYHLIECSIVHSCRKRAQGESNICRMREEWGPNWLYKIDLFVNDPFVLYANGMHNVQVMKFHSLSWAPEPGYRRSHEEPMLCPLNSDLATLHLLLWDSGGEVTNSPPHVLNMGVWQPLVCWWDDNFYPINQLYDRYYATKESKTLLNKSIIYGCSICYSHGSV